MHLQSTFSDSVGLYMSDEEDKAGRRIQNVGVVRGELSLTKPYRLQRGGLGDGSRGRNQKVKRHRLAHRKAKDNNERSWKGVKFSCKEREWIALVVCSRISVCTRELLFIPGVNKGGEALSHCNPFASNTL